MSEWYLDGGLVAEGALTGAHDELQLGVDRLHGLLGLLCGGHGE